MMSRKSTSTGVDNKSASLSKFPRKLSDEHRLHPLRRGCLGTVAEGSSPPSSQELACVHAEENKSFNVKRKSYKIYIPIDRTSGTSIERKQIRPYLARAFSNSNVIERHSFVACRFWGSPHSQASPPPFVNSPHPRSGCPLPADCRLVPHCREGS